MLDEWNVCHLQHCISFYFDGTSFVHKTNPYVQARAVKSLTQRTRNEGLAQYCTSKRKKAGVQGKVIHFLVAITYKKGVICWDKYTQGLNGEFFASYTRNGFPLHFQASTNPRAIHFLQDGDPSQNSTKAQRALQDVGALCLEFYHAHLTSILTKTYLTLFLRSWSEKL